MSTEAPPSVLQEVANETMSPEDITKTRHWPWQRKTTQTAPKRTIYFNQKPPNELFNGNHYTVQYPDNEIHTTKYNLLTFIPKNLFEQLRRLANFYFIALVALQVFPQFNVSSPIYAAMPITFILLVTAMKDAFEDWKRGISDRKMNESIVMVADLRNWNHDLHLSFKKKMSQLYKNVTSIMGQYLMFFISFGKIRPRSKTDSIPMEILSDQKKQKEVSNSDIIKLVEEDWKPTFWMDLKVGDVVFLYNNQSIPADILVLNSSEPDSACFVETKNLDGETNLKLRNGLSAFQQVTARQDLEKMKFRIEAEPPSILLNSFFGALYLQPKQGEEQTLPLTANQLLLRGCTLRNTKWVIGIVLYTGQNTKIIMNSGQTPSKRSKIEKEMNLHVLINFLIVLGLCLTISIIYANSATGLDQLNAPFVPETFIPADQQSSIQSLSIYVFFISLILLQNIVPISLYVTTELCKTMQAIFIFMDIDMYYEPLNITCVPKTWTIADDLGEIEYIFSDKTGTLTRNVMEFRQCSIAGRVYGGQHSADGSFGENEQKMKEEMDRNFKNAYWSTGDPFTFVDLNFTSDLFRSFKEKSSSDSPSQNIKDFFIHLALCHTVLCELKKEDEKMTIEYKAQSPDELALVETAKQCGFAFTKRANHQMTLDILGTESDFEILDVIEFNSHRKRMSVLVRNLQRPDHVLLLIKGADSVIYERLAEGQEEIKQLTLDHLEMFAEEGLRTLCLAQKIISNEQYEQWSESYLEASAQIEGREEAMDRVAEEIENNLMLLGATAIEDRLQDGVPEAIQSLSKGGIKIWVLTGDKVETAINIGFSAGLLTKDMVLLVVRANDYEGTVEQLLKAYKQAFDIDGSMLLTEESVKIEGKEVSFGLEDIEVKPGSSFALVLDGTSLKFALDPRVKKLLVSLSSQCAAVLCCRVSPLQKAQVVRVIKKELKTMTLAIGDGANDVSMIQAANVGVGIQGQEGMQAVMASDYAIAQFRFLSPLLLAHGRWSLSRTAEMTLQMFYKNMIWTLVLFWFQIYSGFTGQILYDYFLILFYNLFYTSLSPLILGSFDQDISKSTALSIPQAYWAREKKTHYSVPLFLLYMLDGIYQSLVCFYLAYFICQEESIEAGGYSPNMKIFGTMAATLAVTNANLYMGLNCLHWVWLFHVSVWGSIAFFFLFIIFYSLVPGSSLVGIPYRLYGTPVFWLALFISIPLCLLPRYLIKYIRQMQFPSDIDILREVEKYKLPLPAQESIGSSSRRQTINIPRTLSAAASKLKNDFEKAIAEPLKKNLNLRRASSLLLHLKTGRASSNTGFAFSQEPGGSEYVNQLTSPKVPSFESMKRKTRDSAEPSSSSLSQNIKSDASLQVPHLPNRTDSLNSKNQQ